MCRNILHPKMANLFAQPMVSNGPGVTNVNHGELMMPVHAGDLPNIPVNQNQDKLS